MKPVLFSTVLAATVAAHGFSARAMDELRKASLHSRRSTMLLGDLIGRSPESLSRSGRDIARILTGRQDATDSPESSDPSSGDASLGDAALGDAALGDAALGDASLGDASSGDASTGDASTGDVSSGDTSSGDASSGDTSSDPSTDPSTGSDPATETSDPATSTEATDPSNAVDATDPAASSNPSASYTPPGALGSPECAADTCCIWSYIVADMASTFSSSSGCTALARGAIRLGFHDAAAWNTTLPFGGADGSLVLNDEENARIENRGLQDITAQMKTWFSQYSSQGVTISMADLIQFGATTAIVSCPGGPKVASYVGRADSNALPPRGLIPSPFADAPTNIALFNAKTFEAADLVALLGAHTVSTQSNVDPSKAGEGQDSTSGTWDTKYFAETASPDTPDGVFKFVSDVSLANDATTSGTWQSFANSLEEWNAAFAPAYFRMSVLGVNNLNDLVDCTQVLPEPSA